MIRKEIAMARNFYIDNINDINKLNEISSKHKNIFCFIFWGYKLSFT